ncbi:MAG: HD domain-containing protein [Clostridiales bacterium]|nr:HD domain-containing protein [Clostridiales bacterium]
MNNKLIREIKTFLKEKISHKRYEHTMGVVKSAVNLAQKYDANVEDAKIAALLHDYAKDFSREELFSYAKKYDIVIDDIMKIAHELLHGKIAALIAEEKFNIKNKDILNAIEYHTTGRVNMSKLEKIIYLSDFIEEGRDYPGVDDLRKIANIDLDRAILQAFDNTIVYVLSIGKLLHPNTLNARNQILLYIKE